MRVADRLLMEGFCLGGVMRGLLLMVSPTDFTYLAERCAIKGYWMLTQSQYPQ